MQHTTRHLFSFALLALIPGCMNEEPTAPSVTAVKEHMSAAQLGLGDPMVNSVGMLLVPIPSGEFLMGSPASDLKADEDEKPQTLKKFGKPFYLSAYEVTQEQYQAVMGIRQFLTDEQAARFPVTDVSYNNAVEFCRRLSEKEDVEYRLPTEAEWEYACRAGTTTAYSFGDDAAKLSEYGWFVDESPDFMPHRIGQKKPNPWGLYDMHGNVWEWCRDRVVRGGSWFDNAWHCRSANRFQYETATFRDDVRGFRVLRPIPEVTASE